jgi:hypothetical protein
MAWQPSLLPFAWLRWRFILPGPIRKCLTLAQSPDVFLQGFPSTTFHATPPSTHPSLLRSVPCAVHQNIITHSSAQPLLSSCLSVLLINPARTMARWLLSSPHSHRTTRLWRNHNQTSESTPSFSLFLTQHAFPFFPSPG